MGMTFFPGTKQNNKFWINMSSTEIDLRHEMDVILGGGDGDIQRGHWVAYRRFDLTETSEYYDPSTGTGKGGPGWEYEDEFYLARKVNFSSIYNEQGMPIGVLPVPFTVFYFEHDLEPKTQDQIYEFTWADNSVTPTSSDITEYTERFDIKAVKRMRDITGRTEFWAVVATGDKTSY